MKRAFIIGNGSSRKWFNLEALRGHGTIYGCNALYRTITFEPDFLVAIDDGMIKEITDFMMTCGASLHMELIVPPEEERWEPVEVNPGRPRSNAGMNAMIEAIKAGHTELYCIGFDFLMHDADKSVSNLYDGTPNYGPETRASYYDNPGRDRFLNWLIAKNPDVHFYFAFPDPKAIRKFSQVNAHPISYMDLIDVVGEQPSSS